MNKRKKPFYKKYDKQIDLHPSGLKCCSLDLNSFSAFKGTVSALIWALSPFSGKVWFHKYSRNLLFNERVTPARVSKSAYNISFLVHVFRTSCATWSSDCIVDLVTFYSYKV